MTDKMLIVASVIAGIVTISGFLWKLFRILKNFDNRMVVIDSLKGENKIIIKSLLATMQGLIQLNCNGPITKCKEELEAYLISK